MKNENLSRSQKRHAIIVYLYRYELFTLPLNAKEAFESGEFSPELIAFIEQIAKVYPKLIGAIEQHLNIGWTFLRLPPLERAILLLGTFELTFGDPNLVIYETIAYVKAFVPGERYRYIHKVLDGVNQQYAKVKTA